jgi:L-asparaginase II
VCLEHGWAPPSEEAVAIACASHNGEPAHVAGVRAVLDAAGIPEAVLRCPEALPRAPAPGEVPARIFHNCSGKHAAMLATAAANGWPLEDYRTPDHALQLAVRHRVEGLAGHAAEAVGVDGCGVPTFAFPLAAAARAFAAFAAEEDAARRALTAMRRHPFLVAGTGRLCTAVMSSIENVVVKIGAEGIVCGALIGAGVAFALKARDGGLRAAECATSATLRHLGAIPGEIAGPLLPFVQPSVTGGGEPVGEVRVRGELQPL